MTILHSNCQLSHLYLSFAPSPQMWQECHTVCLRSHRTRPMFSKCCWCLWCFRSLEWPGGETLLTHSEGHGWICSHLSSYSFFPIMFLCYVGNSRQGRWQGFYGVLSVLLLFTLVWCCAKVRGERCIKT